MACRRLLFRGRTEVTTRNKHEGHRLLWLQPMWDRKRRDTVARVDAAARHLVVNGKPVTLEAIRDTVKTLFNVSMSTNTIHRNEAAHEAYLKYSTTRRNTKAKSASLARLLRSTPVPHRVALRAKINRFRRETKDALILRVIEFEQSIQEQARRENNLREEILRLTLKSGKPRRRK